MTTFFRNCLRMYGPVNRAAWLLIALPMLLAGSLMQPHTAHAATTGTAQVQCNPTTYQSITLNFGQTGPNGATGTSSALNYTCENYGTVSGTVTLCIFVADTYPDQGTQGEMINSSTSQTVKYNLYTDPAYQSLIIPGTPTVLPVTLTVPPTGNNANPQPTGTFTLYGVIPSQPATPPGNYTAAPNIELYYYSGSSTCAAAYANNENGGSSSLSVSVSVTNGCTVTAGGQLNFGNQPATATNITGSYPFNVNCPTKTTYNVGLAPSNGSTNGAGIMKGTGNNTNTIAYQLYSDSAYTVIWGNTATSTNVGNGVSGLGNGSTQTLVVYAKVPNDNVKPDTYSDTVTINVNY